MSKAIIMLSLIGIVLLLIGGILMPNTPIMWWASNSIGFTVLRLLLAGILLALLVTDPPRATFFRLFISVLALGMSIWAISATYDNHMKFIDSLALLQFSISAGLAALERNIKIETDMHHALAETRARIGAYCLQATQYANSLS